MKEDNRNIGLSDILDEISVGYNGNNDKSIKLQKHINEIKDILEKVKLNKGNNNYNFSFVNRDDINILQGSNIFYQGSYATHTAIKHSKYEVDADIAFYIDDICDINVRGEIFHAIRDNINTEYCVELKKPCITVDFKNGYKIDVAIYSKSDGVESMYHHNSINGYEEKSCANPKLIVNEFNMYLKNNDNMRSVIRLVKHFYKSAYSFQNIKENNRVPSISIILFAYLHYKQINDGISEDSLREELVNYIRKFKDYLHENQVLDCKELYILNTFYKVTDFDETLTVLDEILAHLGVSNYASIVSKDVYSSIQNKKKLNSMPPLVGTLG